MAQPVDKLIQRPLYIFDLPEELLYSLQLKVQPTEAAEEETYGVDGAALSQNGEEKQHDGPAKATSCALCNMTFANLLDQRSHVRSDFHGYNIKQKMRGRKAVNEAEFERLVGQLDESISGSDSSESSEDEEEVNGAKGKDTTLSALLKRQAKVTDGDAEDAPVKKRKRGGGKGGMIWFNSTKLPSDTSLGMYRGIFGDDELESDDKLVKTIQSKQLAAKPPPGPKSKEEQEEDGGVPLPESMIPQGTSAAGPHYFLCMIGGGHFAGMIVSLTPKLTKKSGVEDRTATVIAHKTFHRYTTRRKQGGSQSAMDSAKGNAHSAGSSLRRYNETALVQDVRNLLAEWKPLIDTSELIFIRATGSTNRRTLFGPYDDQILSQKDERIRGFPFNTRRATQSELMRAFVELTRVKVKVVDEAAEAKQREQAAAVAAAKAEAAANSTKQTAVKPSKPSKAEEEASLHTTQLQALIRRSKAPGLVSYIQSSSLDPNFRFFPAEQNHHAPTPLHLAASSNSPACASALLVKIKADPTVRNEEGKTPFDISGDRATRDAFRLARSQLGEAHCNWDDARVPAPLSQAEAGARTAREKEEKAAEEAGEKARKERERERLRKEDVERVEQNKEKKFGQGNVLKSNIMTAEERRAEEARGMTDEMRMKLERERRARAAEERIKRMQGK
ncbi:hypothetical protein MBLNU230_g8002t1 [Neophaeotheca triangularis]